MDHFGIGAAINAAVMMYSRAARRTGRTTSLVESVKDGDRIVFNNPKEAERVRRLCLDRGVTVDCMVVEPRAPELMLGLGTPQGRTIFDHSFVEAYYLLAINRAQGQLDGMAQQASGYGAAHRETRRQYEEMAKWQL